MSKDEGGAYYGGWTVAMAEKPLKKVTSKCLAIGLCALFLLVSSSTVAGEEWIPYEPTPEQTDIEIFIENGVIQAKVTLTFPSGGYRVSDWGIVEKIEDEFSVNTKVEVWTGLHTLAITTYDNTYKLGELAPGTYRFTFKAWDNVVRPAIFGGGPGGDWSIQTIDSGSWASMAVDSYGNPHISYRGGTNGDLKYARWTESGWEIWTVGSGDLSDIAIDTYGNPHISYGDYRDLKYARWTGFAWETQIVSSEVAQVGKPSIALDSSGYPHISYSCGPIFGEKFYIKYARWTESGWEIWTVGSGTLSDITIDTYGNPHISYWDYKDLKYARWTGLEWETQIVSSVSSEVAQLIKPSIALDSSGYPHISYSCGAYIKYARWTGSSWDTQTVDEGADVFMVLDSNGHPHISYAGGIPEIYLENHLTNLENCITNSNNSFSYVIELENLLVSYVDLLVSYLVENNLENLENCLKDLENCLKALENSWKNHVGSLENLENCLKDLDGYIDVGGCLESLKNLETTAMLILDTVMALENYLTNNYTFMLLVVENHIKEVENYAEVLDGYLVNLMMLAENLIAISENMESYSWEYLTSEYLVSYFNIKYARWTGSSWDIQIVDFAKIEIDEIDENMVVPISWGLPGWVNSIALDSSGNPHICYKENGVLKHAKLVLSPPPTLSSGMVSPLSGMVENTYTYEVTYADADGDAPSYIRVYIDGVPHDMSYVSGTYAGGALYRYTISGLSAGSHTYYFEAADTRGGSARLPWSGSYSGPVVGKPNDPPTASFTYSPSSPTTDETIQFTDQSTDPDGSIVSWSWDFGDGTTSTLQNPAYRYLSGGTYTVTLTVTDNGGATDNTSQPIVVNQPPTASFVHSPEYPTTDNTIQFTDQSTDPDGTIASWSWDFGDGTTSTSQNPTHRYSSGGTYTVTLTVTDGGGATDNTSRPIVVNQPPTASFVHSPKYPTTDNLIQFTDQSTDPDGTVASWSWDFGDGTTSTLRNPTHRYSDEGTYAVTLTVTDDDGLSTAVSRSLKVISLKEVRTLESFKENLTERTTELDIRLQPDISDAIDDAFLEGKIGACVSVRMPGETHEVTWEYQHPEVEVVVGEVSAGERVEVRVSSDPGNRKTILLNLDSRVLPVAGPWEIDVLYDGQGINMARNYEDVLDPTDETAPEYLLMFGGDGVQIMVSIPSFSLHTITIEKKTVTTEKVTTGPPSPAGQFSALPLALVAGGAVLVVLIVLVRRRFSSAPSAKPFPAEAAGDYERGRGDALEALLGGKIDLKTARRLATAKRPQHPKLRGKSKAYIEGFVRELKRVAKG
jgi:PKD repeat protein